jgi:hypothetical protein
MSGFLQKIQPGAKQRRGDFLQNPKGLNLQRREEHGYTFASVNRLTPTGFPARILMWRKV